MLSKNGTRWSSRRVEAPTQVLAATAFCAPLHSQQAQAKRLAAIGHLVRYRILRKWAAAEVNRRKMGRRR
jgi:hypothetical protein